MSPNDKDDGPPPDAIALLDAVIDHVAEEEAEHGEPTEQDVRWSRDLRRTMQARIAALRSAHTAAPMDFAIRALDREGLLARLEALRQDGGGVHQDLRRLSDDDLRQMLAILVRPTEG
jgi:hypothetical protein